MVSSANTWLQFKEEVIRLLRFKAMQGDKVFLGNPLFQSSSGVRDFKFIADKIHARLEGWKCKLLSRVGRTTLIKLVIQSIPVYCMSTFSVSNAICDELDCLARKFWWTGDVKRHCHLPYYLGIHLSA